MDNQKYIVLTPDVFLQHAIDTLMKHLPCDKRTCFVDVDSFGSLADLNGSLRMLLKINGLRAVIISRGLWLSRVISSCIDIRMLDDINKWRDCIISARMQSLDNIIEKIEGIKRFDGLNASEIEVVRSLRSENNIIDAAGETGIDYKPFLRQTILIARRLSLKNTADLHFFMYRFNK